MPRNRDYQAAVAMTVRAQAEGGTEQQGWLKLPAGG
jgi:hypothetical protein